MPSKDFRIIDLFCKRLYTKGNNYSTINVPSNHLKTVVYVVYTQTAQLKNNYCTCSVTY